MPLEIIPVGPLPGETTGSDLVQLAQTETIESPKPNGLAAPRVRRAMTDVALTKHARSIGSFERAPVPARIVRAQRRLIREFVSRGPHAFGIIPSADSQPVRVDQDLRPS